MEDEWFTLSLDELRVGVPILELFREINTKLDKLDDKFDTKADGVAVAQLAIHVETVDAALAARIDALATWRWWLTGVLTVIATLALASFGFALSHL